MQLPSTQTRTPTETTSLRSRPVIRQTKALSRNLNRLMKSLWPLKPPTRSNKLPQTNVWCPNSKLRPPKPLEWTTSITFIRLLRAKDPPGKQNYLPCHQATASVTTSMQLQWTVHLRNKCHKLNSRREATKGHQRVGIARLLYWAGDSFASSVGLIGSCLKRNGLWSELEENFGWRPSPHWVPKVVAFRASWSSEAARLPAR